MFRERDKKRNEMEVQKRSTRKKPLPRLAGRWRVLRGLSSREIRDRQRQRCSRIVRSEYRDLAEVPEAEGKPVNASRLSFPGALLDFRRGHRRGTCRPITVPVTNRSSPRGSLDSRNRLTNYTQFRNPIPTERVPLRFLQVDRDPNRPQNALGPLCRS